jgi:hypothetical protein
MLKYSKYNSIQGGPFDNINRMIDLEIPEGVQINPSQCFIQFVVHLDGTSDVIRNYVPKLQGNVVIPYNVDLIRNCSLTGDKCGRLEDVRRVNILNHNILELSKGTIEKMCLIDSMYQAKDFNNGYLFSPFVEFHKDGSVLSKYIDGYFRIPLSHLFSLGAIQLLDTNKTGKLRIHLELEKLQYLQVSHVNLFKSANDESVLKEGVFNNLGAPGAVVVTSAAYENLQNSPYYVGQKLTFSYQPIDDTVPDPEPVGPVLELNATITTISYTSDTGIITITLDTPFPALPVGAVTYSNISCEEFGIMEAPTIQVMTCELGIAQYSTVQSSPDVLNYTTFTTEEYSTGGLSKYLNKVFEIESNAINAMLFFNQNNANPLSNNIHLDNYRMRIDNQDVYDRNINTNYLTGKLTKLHLTNDSLHMDSINRTFLNASIPLRNLTMMAMVRDREEYSNEMRFANGEDGENNRIMILASPTPITNTTKKLQFNLENKDGHPIEDVILYKQCLRTVKF